MGSWEVHKKNRSATQSEQIVVSAASASTHREDHESRAENYNVHGGHLVISRLAGSLRTLLELICRDQCCAKP